MGDWINTAEHPGVDSVAIATFVLAAVTVCAILAPIVQGNIERHRRKLSGLMQLKQVVLFFQRRVSSMLEDQHLNPDLLMRGMDVALGRALADDVAQLLPDEDVSFAVYSGIFGGHDALVRAVSLRSRTMPPEVEIRDALEQGYTDLTRAGTAVNGQLASVQRKSWVDIWLGR